MRHWLETETASLRGHVNVHNEQELDQLPKTHPNIAALPIDLQARKDLHQLAPKSKNYVYIMMDSGASIHAQVLVKQLLFPKVKKKFQRIRQIEAVA